MNAQERNYGKGPEEPKTEPSIWQQVQTSRQLRNFSVDKAQAMSFEEIVQIRAANRALLVYESVLAEEKKRTGFSEKNLIERNWNNQLSVFFLRETKRAFAGDRYGNTTIEFIDSNTQRVPLEKPVIVRNEDLTPKIVQEIHLIVTEKRVRPVIEEQVRAI